MLLALLDHVDRRGSAVHTRDSLVSALSGFNQWDVADHLARCAAAGFVVETQLPSVGGIGNTAYRFTLRLTRLGAERLSTLRDAKA